MQEISAQLSLRDPEDLLPGSARPDPALIQFTPWDLVLALAWSPDGNLLAVSAGEFVYLYNPETLAETRSLETGVWSPALAFDPRGARLATGSRDGSVRLWDLRSGRLAKTIDTHPKGVNSLVYDPGGNLLASSGNDGMVRIWEVSSGEIAARLIGGVYAVPAVAFSRDGALLATADGRNLRLREVETQRLALTMQSSESFYTLAYSPDGALLAAGDSANGVQIWDASEGTLLRSLDGHAGNPDRVSGLVWQVAFSPDGRTLASAGGDATVRLWDVATGQALETLAGHRLAVTSLAFSPDGRWLASGSLDATVRIWDMNTRGIGDKGVGITYSPVPYPLFH
jgi:WD40 repeat protein